jgi:hypothetical protein
MTDTSGSPESDFTEAVQDLSDQTRLLVRREITAALREMAGRAKQGIPAAALLASAGVFGIFTIVSSYRLSLRLLERRLSPAAAAMVAVAGYGTGAACAAAAAAVQLRRTPLPVPSRTTRDASQAVASAAAESGATQPAGSS